MLVPPWLHDCMRGMPGTASECRRMLALERGVCGSPRSLLHPRDKSRLWRREPPGASCREISCRWAVLVLVWASRQRIMRMRSSFHCCCRSLYFALTSSACFAKIWRSSRSSVLRDVSSSICTAPGVSVKHRWLPETGCGGALL